MNLSTRYSFVAVPLWAPKEDQGIEIKETSLGLFIVGKALEVKVDGWLVVGLFVFRSLELRIALSFVPSDHTGCFILFRRTPPTDEMSTFRFWVSSPRCRVVGGSLF